MMLRARCFCLATRASDEPMSPRPMRQRRSKSGGGVVELEASATRTALALLKVLQGGDDEAIGLFRADREAQTLRQMVDVDGAQDEAALGQERVGLARLCGSLEMQQKKIADARRDRNAEALDLFRQPGEPFVVMRDRLVDMRDIFERGDARLHRHGRNVERAANAVQRIADCERRIAPAKT